MAHNNTLLHEILTFVGNVGEALYSSPATSMSALTRHMMRQMFAPTYPYREVGKALSHLKYRGYLQEMDGVITLTPKGRAKVSGFKLESLKLDTSQPWDGRWRVVIWDVPEKQRKQRDLIRGILKKLNFVRIQRSIWVSPYPCRDEIAYLREEIGLTTGLVYLESDFIEDHGRLRRHFHLLSPNVEE